MNYIVKYLGFSTNTQISKINLPSSKSEANRLLIIKALCEENFTIDNLASARDTATLNKLLEDRESLTTFDVLDAGTAMRFLTAYLAVTTKKEVTLTGTERMQHRPIGTLVEALRSVGAEINYLDKEAYPPLQIAPFQKQASKHIQIKGNISSQYISALLMVAPILPEGLHIEILPPVYSLPYINMTVSLMRQAGIKVDMDGTLISIKKQAYQSNTIEVESDWSGASYWYAHIALSNIGAKLILKGLREESNQGDQAIAQLMQYLGVRTSYQKDGVEIEKVDAGKEQFMKIDFKKFPDLAQTFVVACAALKVDLEMTGLESLRIKETDRVNALDQELRQFNCSLKEVSEGKWALKSQNFELVKEAKIRTYEDHRMAMSFLPLAQLTKLVIEDAEVVNKSYPSFWKDAATLNYSMDSI